MPRSWTPSELRELASTKPSPMQPFLEDTMRQALRYCADVIEAANEAINGTKTDDKECEKP